MSLEGLSSLIQLESTRLEGFKQTTQNIQQVNGEVQRIGVQVSQNKISIWRDRINTECDKEIAQAAVRKAESKLARAKKSEQMAQFITTGVAAISTLSNVWDAASKLIAESKLGNIPDYLKTTPINKDDPTTKAFTSQPDSNGNRSLNAISSNTDGTETVFRTNVDARGTSSTPQAATVSYYDINSIVGKDNDYARLTTKLNEATSFDDAKKQFPNLTQDVYDKFKSTGQPSFALLAQTSPDLATKVMDLKGHGMSRDESSNFAEVLEKFMPTSSVTLEHSPPTPPKVEASADNKPPSDAETLARIQAELIKDLPRDKQLAKMSEIINDKDKGKIEMNGKPISSMKPEDLLAAIQTEIAKPSATDPKPTKNPENYTFIVNKRKDGSSEVTMHDKTKGETTTVTFPKGEPKLANGTPQSFEDIFKGDNAEAVKVFTAKVQEKGADVRVVSGKVEGTDTNKADLNMQTKNIDGKAYQGAIAGLKSSGHLKDSNILNKAVKAISDIVVNIAKDTTPYFQAYLDAKTKTEQAQDDLAQAVSKLNSYSKKLKAIQMQLDLFNGKGA